MSDGRNRAEKAEEMREPDQGERVQRILRNPLVLISAVLAVGTLLFALGYSIGYTLHGAFDGDGRRALLYGFGLVIFVPGIIGLGVLGDRKLRRRHRC